MNSLTYRDQTVIDHQNYFDGSNSAYLFAHKALRTNLEELITETPSIPSLEEIYSDRSSPNFVAKAFEKIKKGRYYVFKGILEIGQVIFRLKSKSSSSQFQQASTRLRELCGVSNCEQKTALKIYTQFYKTLLPKQRRQLNLLDRPVWNLTLLNKLCQLSPDLRAKFFSQLNKLTKSANLGYSCLKALIEFFLPAKYLKRGQRLREIDLEMIAAKLEISGEKMAQITNQAQNIAQSRLHNPTLLTDDILEALINVGYDIQVLLPPPPKPTQREAQALALASQAERERAEALSLIQRLQQEIWQLRQQVDSSTSNVEISAPTDFPVEATLFHFSTQPDSKEVPIATVTNEVITTDAPLDIAEIQVEQEVSSLVLAAKSSCDNHYRSEVVDAGSIEEEITDLVAEEAMASSPQRSPSSENQLNSPTQGQRPAHCFIKGAKVGIWNEIEQKIVKYGKMFSKVGQKILVDFSQGCPQLYELKQLRIIEQPSSASKKSPKPSNFKGFGEKVNKKGVGCGV